MTYAQMPVNENGLAIRCTKAYEDKQNKWKKAVHAVKAVKAVQKNSVLYVI